MEKLIFTLNGLKMFDNVGKEEINDLSKSLNNVILFFKV